MSESSYRPRKRTYKPLPDGTWEKPEPDDYFTVITKHYTDSGGVTSKTWFYEYGSLHGGVDIKDGCVFMVKHMPDGRHQTSYIPLTEVLRIDYNEPSAGYNYANDMWHKQEYGMSSADYREMEEGQRKVVFEEKFRRTLADQAGVDPSHVHIIETGEGTYTASIKLEDDDDGS